MSTVVSQTFEVLLTHSSATHAFKNVVLIVIGLLWTRDLLMALTAIGVGIGVTSIIVHTAGLIDINVIGASALALTILGVSLRYHGPVAADIGVACIIGWEVTKLLVIPETAASSPLSFLAHLLGYVSGSVTAVAIMSLRRQLSERREAR